MQFIQRRAAKLLTLFRRTTNFPPLQAVFRDIPDGRKRKTPEGDMRVTKQ
jgi:hypothetical protein